MPILEFTGERYTPECVREMLYEHYARYAMAMQFCAGKRVLDCACGEGYGSALLAQTAAQVTGVDVDPHAVEHARARYFANNLRFQKGDALNLSGIDPVELLVSFETLEHLEQHDALLASFKRSLLPNGVLLISTPDKYRYSDVSGYQNEFHVKELYREEFESLLARHFKHFRIYGQSLLFQSHLWDLQSAEHQVSARRLDTSKAMPTVESGLAPTPMYFVAFASDSEAEIQHASGQLHLFADTEQSIYAHYNDEIRKGIQAGQRLAELEAEIATLKTKLAAFGA